MVLVNRITENSKILLKPVAIVRSDLAGMSPKIQISHKSFVVLYQVNETVSIFPIMNIHLAVNRTSNIFLICIILIADQSQDRLPEKLIAPCVNYETPPGNYVIFLKSFCLHLSFKPVNLLNQIKQTNETGQRYLP
jgi:hypothetical protein